MTAERKPSKVAHAAAAVLLSGKKGGATLKEIAEAGAVIDREAVAPAVRELAERSFAVLTAIDYIATSMPIATDAAVFAALREEAEKYRHLIEGDET